MFGSEGEEGGWYGDHDDFRSHQPLGGVARAAKIDLEKPDDEEDWDGFEDGDGEGDIVDAFEEEVAEEGDRHGRLSASGWEVLDAMTKIGLVSGWQTRCVNA